MDEQQRAELAAKVRETRNARGWSQARLAREAGVSENTVMKLEQATRATQPTKIRQILDALGIAPLAETAIDLEGLPEDVQVFLRVVVLRLRAIEDDAVRQRLLNDLYPRLLLDG